MIFFILALGLNSDARLLRGAWRGPHGGYTLYIYSELHTRAQPDGELNAKPYIKDSLGGPNFA